MKSMTGYACRENADKDMSVSVEIKGYNNRFLDLVILLPSWLSALEPVIRAYVANRFIRGKIEINIRIKEYNSEFAVALNKKAAHAYYAAITELAVELGISEKPSLNEILNLEGVLDAEKVRDTEKYWPIIQPLLAAAVDQFEEERSREGLHTREDILLHIGILEDSARVIEKLAPVLENTIKENLKTRFNELLGDRIDDHRIEENRILAETAVLLMKHTISEELSRLAGHLAEFRLEVDRVPVQGKKLDFLSQEINREINTIGSKSPVLEVSRAVVDMKNALENIREQLRNVE